MTMKNRFYAAYQNQDIIQAAGAAFREANTLFNYGNPIRKPRCKPPPFAVRAVGAAKRSGFRLEHWAFTDGALRGGGEIVLGGVAGRPSESMLKAR